MLDVPKIYAKLEHWKMTNEIWNPENYKYYLVYF